MQMSGKLGWMNPRNYDLSIGVRQSVELLFIFPPFTCDPIRGRMRPYDGQPNAISRSLRSQYPKRACESTDLNAVYPGRRFDPGRSSRDESGGRRVRWTAIWPAAL